MRIRRRFPEHLLPFVLPLVLAASLAAAGCGPKEAEDPSDILAEDYERAGQDPETDEPEKPDPGLDPASRAECESAMRRVFALGGAEPTADQLRERVSECLARGTSRREAACIAKLKSESDIDRCAHQ